MNQKKIEKVGKVNVYRIQERIKKNEIKKILYLSIRFGEHLVANIISNHYFFFFFFILKSLSRIDTN